MRRPSGHRARRCLASVVLLAGLSGAGTARAQDLDPGTYTNAPVGANVLVLALGRTSGEIVFDPTLPVEDATAAINAGTVIYARALGLAAGELEPGTAADLFTLDIDAPSLSGWTQETLLDSFVLGAGLEAVAETCVGGVWV